MKKLKHNEADGLFNIHIKKIIFSYFLRLEKSRITFKVDWNTTKYGKRHVAIAIFGILDICGVKNWLI
jgi:hypothetical protein